MKKVLLFLLIILPIYLSISIYFLDKNYFICPIEYKKDIVIRNDSRGDGFFAANRNGNRIHQGIDLFGAIGTPVMASLSGKVVVASQNRGMGNYIILKHLGNLVTIYGHLSNIYVKQGALVRQGQLIGEVGKTGNANLRSILPHLHFEIRKNGTPQDPLEYLE